MSLAIKVLRLGTRGPVEGTGEFPVGRDKETKSIVLTGVEKRSATRESRDSANTLVTAMAMRAPIIVGMTIFVILIRGRNRFDRLDQVRGLKRRRESGGKYNDLKQ